ncbi:hypothetical protein V2W45_1339160 [Cenococcum geophilum]
MKQFHAFMLATSTVPSVASGFGKFGQQARDNLARHEKVAKKAEVLRLRSLVDSLPGVPLDIGEMYSGLVPINYDNTSEALFFVFQQY